VGAFFSDNLVLRVSTQINFDRNSGRNYFRLSTKFLVENIVRIRDFDLTYFSEKCLEISTLILKFCTEIAILMSESNAQLRNRNQNRNSHVEIETEFPISTLKFLPYQNEISSEFRFRLKLTIENEIENPISTSKSKPIFQKIDTSNFRRN
jgi:hypothetical protein